MLATTLGIEFDPEKDYDERKKEFLLSGKIIKTSSITQSALGDKDGLWTSVVAAAVFVGEEEEGPPIVTKDQLHLTDIDKSKALQKVEVKHVNNHH